MHLFIVSMGEELDTSHLVIPSNDCHHGLSCLK